RGGDRSRVHRGKEDGCDRRSGRDTEGAEKSVSRAGPQLEPRGAGAEVRDGEDAAAEVVGTEERGRPAASLRGRLARGRGGEECEAERPERLLPGRARAVRPKQEE